MLRSSRKVKFYPRVDIHRALRLPEIRVSHHVLAEIMTPHKKELLSLVTKMKQRKLTIVPISLYNKGRLIKLELALGKPKKKFEKREELRRRDINREIVEKRTEMSFGEFLQKCIKLLEEMDNRNILSGMGELLDEKQKAWAKTKLKDEAIFQLKLKLAP